MKKGPEPGAKRPRPYSCMRFTWGFLSHGGYPKNAGSGFDLLL